MPPENLRIERVHVIAMNHLDVGFSCPGCGGAGTPRDEIDAVPAPYTWRLLNLYMNRFLPDAAETSRATNGSCTVAPTAFDPMPGTLASCCRAGYKCTNPKHLPRIGIPLLDVYTTHCFLVSFFFDCESIGSNAEFPIECPKPAVVASVTRAVELGWIVWHAFPFNAEPEAADAELFGAGIDMCHSLSDRFHQPRPRVLSQRDVPGMTRAVIPLLVERGVTALTVGANTYSASAAVPRIYRWRDPDSGSSVIALQHPGGYGDSSTVIANGSVNALHLMFNGDNAGPHSPEEVAARHAKLAALYPNAQITGATWDGYIEAIMADGSAAALPETQREEGDTWIYGVQQDLYKTAAFRGIMRLAWLPTRFIVSLPWLTGRLCYQGTEALRRRTWLRCLRRQFNDSASQLDALCAQALRTYLGIQL